MKEVYDILYSGVWHRALLSFRTNTAAHTRVKTRVPHEWRRTINTRSQWEVNSIEPRKIIARKQRKTSQVFTSSMTQHCGDRHLSVLSPSKKWLRYGRAYARCPIQGDDGLIEVSIERTWLYLLNWMRGNLISRCLGNSGFKHPYYTTNMNITILIWSHPTRSGPAWAWL